MPKSIKFKDLIIFENDQYIAVNKPAGMASLHERISDGNSLIELAQEFADDLHLCHRLDKETTGVLLLAKNIEAYSHASVGFERRSIKKTYHAITEGIHPFHETLVKLPLHITRSGRSSVNHIKGKECITVFNTIESFKHYSLVEALPQTGRLHQIRIHLASQHAPIAGDLIYGGSWPLLSKIKKKYSYNRTGEEQPLITRFALHARSLQFKDKKGESIEITADYPKDFAVFLKQLRKYDQA